LNQRRSVCEPAALVFLAAMTPLVLTRHCLTPLSEQRVIELAQAVLDPGLVRVLGVGRDACGDSPSLHLAELPSDDRCHD
jgi:hypothetical protein